MSGKTHPGVAATLSRAGLTSIVEAHCVIGLEGKTYDFAGLPTGDQETPYSSIAELALARLDQKQALHRAALADWAARREINAPIEQLWAIREQCIRDLADTRRQE